MDSIKTERLILVRHASTMPLETGNVDTRHWDEYLSGLGQLQAKALAQRLSKIHIDAIYSSPQPRALATARIIRPEAQIIDDLEDWRDEEGYRAIYKRVTRFAGSLRDGTFVLVSHSAPITMILGERVLAPIEYQASWGITPASISVVQNGIVVAVNDTSHLGLYPEMARYNSRTWTYDSQ